MESATSSTEVPLHQRLFISSINSYIYSLHTHSHRCSLTGQDLNRQWKHPDPVLHPSIYHVKTLMETMTQCGKKPIVSF